MTLVQTLWWMQIGVSWENCVFFWKLKSTLCTTEIYFSTYMQRASPYLLLYTSPSEVYLGRRRLLR